MEFFGEKVKRKVKSLEPMTTALHKQARSVVIYPLQDLWTDGAIMIFPVIDPLRDKLNEES